ncbi:MAG: hypothetical protein R2716_13840 [Microthrixaceae bacterium]
MKAGSISYPQAVRSVTAPGERFELTEIEVEGRLTPAFAKALRTCARSSNVPAATASARSWSTRGSAGASRR